MTVKPMRLMGNTAAIPVALGPSAEVAVTTNETKAATAMARTGRSNHRRRADGAESGAAIRAKLGKANPAP